MAKLSVMLTPVPRFVMNLFEMWMFAGIGSAAYSVGAPGQLLVFQDISSSAIPEELH